MGNQVNTWESMQVEKLYIGVNGQSGEHLGIHVNTWESMQVEKLYIGVNR